MDYLGLASDRLSYCLTSQKLSDREIQDIKALQEKLDKCIIEIAAFGLVSRGKTAVLNALLGKKIGETGALNGTTQDVVSMAWYGEESFKPETNYHPKVQLKLTDTPGLDEIDGEARAEMAESVAKQADLILFVISGDINRQELDALNQLRQACKPILLVFNKIDLFPDCDRQDIYAALQEPELQKLISPSEILLTAAEPLPVKVRVQSTTSQETVEIWEKPAIDVYALKTKILDLLNQEGKALLAVNAMGQLAEIQDNLLKRHLENLPRVRDASTVIFIAKAIALSVSPLIWWDIAISLIFDIAWFAWWVQQYSLTQKQRWLGIVLANAAIAGLWGLETNLTQIAWLGIATPTMLKLLQADLLLSSGLGLNGAKTLIEQIFETVPANSLLKRIAPV